MFRKYLIGVVSLIVIWVGLISAARQENVIEVDENNMSAVQQIESAYAQGTLDLNQRIEYLVRSVYAPASIPLEFQGDTGGSCETWLYDTVFRNWSKLDSQTRHRISRFGFDLETGAASRPGGLNESVSSDHFKIHYTTDPGDTNAVNSWDGDGNGTPDYIDLMLAAFEHSYSILTDTLNFAPPPGDSLAGTEYGEDSKYDIYVVKIPNPGTYGVTHPEFKVNDNPKSTPAETNAATSYIRMRNEYTDFSVGTEGAIHVTAAHEFFHAVQGGIDVYEKAWLKESTAAWMEDRVYPAVDDNYGYLDDFFLKPYVPLDATKAESKGHWYGSWVFFQYLSEHYGDNIVQEIWAETRNNDSSTGDFSFTNINVALGMHATNFNNEFSNFIIANLIQSDPPYNYQQADYFPTVYVTEDIYAPYRNYTWDLDRHASRYFRVSPNIIPDGTDEIKFTVQPKSAASDLGFAVITRQGANYDYHEFFSPNNNFNFTLPNTRNYDDIYFVAMNPEGVTRKYTVSIITSGKLRRITRLRDESGFYHAQTNADYAAFRRYEYFYEAGSSSDRYTFYQLRTYDIAGIGKSSFNFRQVRFVPYLGKNSSNMLIEGDPPYPGYDRLYSYHNGNLNTIALSVNDSTPGYPHFDYLQQVTVDTGRTGYIIGEIIPKGGGGGRGIWSVNLKSGDFTQLIGEGESEQINWLSADQGQFVYEVYNQDTDHETLYRYANGGTDEIISADYDEEADFRHIRYDDELVMFYMWDEKATTEKLLIRDFSGGDSLLTLTVSDDLDDISVATKNKRVVWAEAEPYWASAKVFLWENGVTQEIYSLTANEDNYRYIMQQTEITPNIFDQRLSLSDNGIAWMEVDEYSTEYYFQYYQFADGTMYTADLTDLLGGQQRFLKIDLQDNHAVLTVFDHHDVGGIYVLDLGDITTGIRDDHQSLPGRFTLRQNYPNPFNASTRIKFTIPSEQPVQLTVFNLVGKRVDTILDRVLSAGDYNLGYRGADLPSGIYFYRLQTPEYTKARKMILLK